MQTGLIQLEDHQDSIESLLVMALKEEDTTTEQTEEEAIEDMVSNIYYESDCIFDIGLIL